MSPFDQNSAAGPEGVPPLNGEPLPLEFANTVFPVRGTLRDGFRSPEHVAWWLRSCHSLFSTRLTERQLAGVDASDVHCFVLLRDAARRLIDARVRRHDPDPWDVAQVNRVSALGRPWPALCWGAGQQPTAVQCGAASPVVTVQAEIAQALVELLAGTSGVEPTPCRAPGCVFFFDAGRSRRQWCSAGCGNRARAARHYARHHASEPTSMPHTF